MKVPDHDPMNATKLVTHKCDFLQHGIEVHNDLIRYSCLCNKKNTNQLQDAAMAINSMSVTQYATIMDNNYNEYFCQMTDPIDHK